MGLQTAFTPYKLGHLQFINRFIKSATNEGMTTDGFPLPSLVDFHARQASGGVAMTTVAYGAVSPDGRTMPGQMYLRPEVVPALQGLTDAVHRQGAAASLQLTHCGYFSKNRQVTGKKPLAPSRRFNEYGALSGLICAKAMNQDDIRQTVADFGNAALHAKESGFDAVELHMGHGYLISQFLSPVTNRRTDRYGGSLLNRARLGLEVLDAVKKAVGEGFPVLCKVNLSDDIRGGFTLEDSAGLVRMLQDAGADALVLSGGFTSKTPFFLLRGEVPLWRMVRAEKEFPQKLAMAVFGPLIIRKYKFRENFFLPLARVIRNAVSMPLAYLGGVISAAGVEQVMNDGFDLVAIGRALIHDPDFILKMKSDPGFVSGCTHCNLCVAEMERGGVRCPVNPLG